MTYYQIKSSRINMGGWVGKRYQSAKLAATRQSIHVVTKTWNDLQRPTTIHNDPQRPTTTPQRPHNDPTTTYNDPLRPTTTHYDPRTTHNDPTTTPQRSQNYLQLQFCMTINNISYCLWIHHIFYYCKAFDPNPDLHENRWDLKRGE
jgi:hypothetical protein